MKNIDVSVIILSYNFENYIETSIISALFQNTNFNYEIIISDDCSEDLTYKKISKLSFLDKKIKISQNNKRLGANENLKNALNLANGKYISFLDGDDYWLQKDKLQNQFDFLEKNIDFSMCFTGYIRDNITNYWPDENGAWLGLVGYENNEVTTNDLLKTNLIATSTVMFRNSGEIFKPYFNKIKFLDWALNFEMSKLGKIKYLDHPCAMYRYHGNGISSSLTTEELKTEILKIKKIFSTNLINE